jgi:hypothetical protein
MDSAGQDSGLSATCMRASLTPRAALLETLHGYTLVQSRTKGSREHRTVARRLRVPVMDSSWRLRSVTIVSMRRSHTHPGPTGPFSLSLSLQVCFSVSLSLSLSCAASTRAMRLGRGCFKPTYSPIVQVVHRVCPRGPLGTYPGVVGQYDRIAASPYPSRDSCAIS